MATQKTQSMFDDSPKSSDLKSFFTTFDERTMSADEREKLKKEVCSALLSKVQNVKDTPTELLHFLTKTFVGNYNFSKFCLENKIFENDKVKELLDGAAIKNGYMNFAHFFKRALDAFPKLTLTLNDLQLLLKDDKQLFQDTLEKNLYKSVLKTHTLQELIEDKLQTTFDFSDRMSEKQIEDSKLERLKKIFSDVKFVEHLIENGLFITSKFEKTPLYELFDEELKHLQGASSFAEIMSEYLDQTKLTRSPVRQQQLKSILEQFRLINDELDVASTMSDRMISGYSFMEEASVFDDEFIGKVVEYEIDRQAAKKVRKL